MNERLRAERAAIKDFVAFGDRFHHHLAVEARAGLVVEGELFQATFTVRIWLGEVDDVLESPLDCLLELILCRRKLFGPRGLELIISLDLGGCQRLLPCEILDGHSACVRASLSV